MTGTERTRRWRCVLLVLWLAVAGCSGSVPGTPPERVEFTMEEVAGSYVATLMDAVDNGERDPNRDLLADGAEMEIVLTADGTSSGRFFVPRDARPFREDPGSDLEVDLTGSWSILQTDPIVNFRFDAETFLDDPNWSITDRDVPALTLGADLNVVTNNTGLEISLTRR